MSKKQPAVSEPRTPVGSVGERLYQARRMLGLQPADVMERLGLSASELNAMEHGADVPADLLARFAQLYRRKLDWLQTGVVPDITVNAIFVDAMRKVTRKDREKILDFQDFLATALPPPKGNLAITERETPCQKESEENDVNKS